MLTIGMATIDDYDGVVFTIQSLILHHDVSGCEIVVVDNRPASPHGQAVREFCAKRRSEVLVRYVPMPDVQSTTQTRQRIFDEARGDTVLVIDCHVLLPSGAIGRLKQWYADRPDARDLYSGPMILESGGFHTHFNWQWRGQMLGTWGAAWHCACGQLQFACVQVGDRVAYRDLATSRQEVTACACSKQLPACGWSGHEVTLMQAGLSPLGFSDNDPPFEIPGQGLGLFTCRKDAWPGFNPHFRGFGGEELYIHEKFRRRGDKAICLPWLRWWHRFGRPTGVPYQASAFDKCRNYVLGHVELGLPLDPIHEHFVSLETKGQSLARHLQYEHGFPAELLAQQSPEQLDRIHRSVKVPQAWWDALIADPVSTLAPQQRPPQPPPPVTSGWPQPPQGAGMDEIYEFIRSIPRDLDKHLPALRALAGQCGHVTEITKRRESLVGLMAGRPHTAISWLMEKDPLQDRLRDVVRGNERNGTGHERGTHVLTIHELQGTETAHIRIEPTELLFIDSRHHADRLRAELEPNIDQVSRFLVIRGTGHCGEKAEDGQGPGLFHGIRWLMQSRPEWRIIYHTNDEYGLTVLSRDERDWPKVPVHAWPPEDGAGSEFAALVAELGITMPDNCTCKALKNQMDMQGPAWCRDNKPQLEVQIKANAGKWGWTEKLANIATAGWKSITTGLALKINPLDPIPSLFDEAVRRAEVKERKVAA